MYPITESSVKLIAIRRTSDALGPEDFIWLYQTNTNPWDTTETAEWTAYSDKTCLMIEQAFRNDCQYIFIDATYRIDFEHFIQQHIDDLNCQRPIRRQQRSTYLSSLSTDRSNDITCCRRERLSFPIGLVSYRSTSIDTNYHGLPFVIDWLVPFTKGKMKVKFASIFPVLVQGLIEEGQMEAENVISEIVDTLNKVKYETRRKREKKKMQRLQKCCVKLYTKNCYIYRVLNMALRDDDRTKLNTLGPFCYLIYNYIGKQSNDHLLIGHRLRETFHHTESPSMIVYRGDYVSHETIEEYRKVIGNHTKYFKWLPFVSTSLDREVAESFGCNVLYIIELERYTSCDQFSNITTNTYHNNEFEVLLRPGVRFRIINVKFDDLTGKHLVHIKIVPSYVSSLI